MLSRPRKAPSSRCPSPSGHYPRGHPPAALENTGPAPLGAGSLFFCLLYGIFTTELGVPYHHGIFVSPWTRQKGIMKTDLHPTYHQAKVTCTCGNTFTVGSTEPEIKVEICSNCHPFYTGTAKLIDTAGRLDKFQARLQKKATLDSQKTEKKPRIKNQK